MEAREGKTGVNAINVDDIAKWSGDIKGKWSRIDPKQQSQEIQRAGR